MRPLAVTDGYCLQPMLVFNAVVTNVYAGTIL